MKNPRKNQTGFSCPATATGTFHQRNAVPFRSASPAQTYHHVNVPHCLGLDATKIEAMFGTAKKHGAIRRAFFCKDLKKILSVNLTALRVDIFAFVRRYLRPRL